MASLSCSENAYPGTYGWVSVGELTEAVASNLLTSEEARAVLWSQLPVLQRQASITPPAIEKASA